MRKTKQNPNVNQKQKEKKERRKNERKNCFILCIIYNTLPRAHLSCFLASVSSFPSHLISLSHTLSLSLTHTHSLFPSLSLSLSSPLEYCACCTRSFLCPRNKVVLLIVYHFFFFFFFFFFFCPFFLLYIPLFAHPALSPGVE